MAPINEKNVSLVAQNYERKAFQRESIDANQGDSSEVFGLFLSPAEGSAVLPRDDMRAVAVPHGAAA